MSSLLESTESYLRHVRHTKLLLQTQPRFHLRRFPHGWRMSFAACPNYDKHFNQKVLGFVLRENANCLVQLNIQQHPASFSLANKISVYDSLLGSNAATTTTNFRVIAFRKCSRQIPRSCCFCGFEHGMQFNFPRGFS